MPHNILYPKNGLKSIGNTIITLYFGKILTMQYEDCKKFKSASTVYCKLFEVEKFHGWTRYFKFAGKLSRFVRPGQNVLTCVDYAISLIEHICLIIPNTYIYHLTCRFLTLADMAKQCGCKIVSS